MNLTDTLQKVPLLPAIVRNSRSFRSRLIDRRLGIQTAEEQQGLKAAVSRFNDHREFEAMDYACIRTFLNALNLSRHDVVYDIGCGTGRVLCVAARQGVRKCVGVELCPELVEEARANARSLRPPKSPIEIRLADAALTDYSEGTVYCIFNSFGVRTLQVVLGNIERSVQQNPRRIQIGYACPTHSQTLHECGWLRPRSVVRFLTHRYFIQLWENMPAEVTPRFS